MDSDQVLGPYKVETDSVLPNLENNDNGRAEDEAISSRSVIAERGW